MLLSMDGVHVEQNDKNQRKPDDYGKEHIIHKEWPNGRQSFVWIGGFTLFAEKSFIIAQKIIYSGDMDGSSENT